MNYFENAIRALERMGVADVLLPFLLIFTISYAVLIRLPLFNVTGGNKKGFSIAIAFVLAMLVVFPHVTGDYSATFFGKSAVDLINESLPFVGVWMVIGLGALLLMGMFGLDIKKGEFLSGLLGFFSFIVVLYIFGSSAGWFRNIQILRYLGPDTQAILLVLGVFVLFVYLITGEDPGQGQDSSLDKVINAIKRSFN